MRENKKIDIERVLTLHEKEWLLKDIAKFEKCSHQRVSQICLIGDAVKTGNIDAMREYDKRNGPTVKAICLFYNVPYDVLSQPVVPEVVEEPVQEEEPKKVESPAEVHTSCNPNCERLLSLLLDEQHKTNELLIQMMDVVFPHYYGQIRGQIDSVAGNTMATISNNCDVINNTIIRNANTLDSIKDRLKRGR